MMLEDLDFIFNPRSVAVIGASDNPQKWGNWMSRSLIESTWKGDIYLINPKGAEVCGRKTYPTILDVEGSIDLALIGIPIGLVPAAVQQCVEKGVKGIIIISAGFGETGEEGKKLESEIVEMVRKRGTRIVGPNCAGIYNSSVGLNATIVSFLEGPIALISQSGNFALNLNFFAKKRGLGFSKWVSAGNQFVKCSLPEGNKVAILSDGGGDATMAADAAEGHGLRVSVLSEETQEKLNGVIPRGAVHSLKNPVDFASEADLWCFSKCSEILLQDEGIDALLIVGGFGSYKDALALSGFGNLEEDISVAISDLHKKYGKPLLLESNNFIGKPKSLEI